MTIPALPRAAIARPRLGDLLQQSAGCPLTIVSASAGWGKTTALAEWARATTTTSVGWISVGPLDDSRRRFMATLTTGIGVAVPTVASLEPPPSDDLDGFFAELLAALSAAAEPVSIVVDAQAHLTHPRVLSDLETLASESSDQVMVILASRADPAIGLERRRLAGELFEIRAKQLAFTAGELDGFLDEAGIRLGPTGRELLLERTQGWPAAIGLAAQALVGHPDPEKFVRTFSGNHRAISDYLVAEVLDRLDATTREMLVAASVADEVSEELVAALMDDPRAGLPLARLARGSGLLSTTDETEVWFRLHPLLLEVLRTELRRRPAERVATLHANAAGWFRDAGRNEEALRHFGAAERWPEVAALLLDVWLARLVRGKAGSLRALMAQVPPQVAEREPEIVFVGAGLAMDAGEADRAAGLLARSATLIHGISAERRARLEAARATMFPSSNDQPDDNGHPAAAISPDVRAMALVGRGTESFWRGEPVAAASALEEAAGLASDSANEFVLVAALSALAAVYQFLGHPFQARGLAESALALAARRGWVDDPRVAIAYVAQSVEALAAGHLGRARERIELARTSAIAGDRRLRRAIAGCRARLLALEGDPLSALEVLRAADFESDPPGWQLARATRLEIDLLLQLGHGDRARRLLDASEQRLGADELGTARAQLELSAGDPQAVSESITDAWLGSCGSTELRTEGLALRATALELLGRQGEADEALVEALDLAEPAAYSQMLRRLGHVMAGLLRRHARRAGAHAAFATEVLAAPAESASTWSSSSIVEPLSERELAVLRFLPTMLSNAEIAAELFISVNTVKTHVRHIYRKLEVAHRRQAVQRARQLNLLNPGLAQR